MDRYGTGKRTRDIYEHLLCATCLHMVYFHQHSWELASASCCRAWREALGRVRSLPDIMLLVSRAGFEPRSVETEQHWRQYSVSSEPAHYSSAPFVHVLPASGRPDKRSDAPLCTWTAGQMGTFPSPHCPSASKGQRSFLTCPSALWSELTRAGAISYLSILRACHVESPFKKTEGTKEKKEVERMDEYSFRCNVWEKC